MEFLGLILIILSACFFTANLFSFLKIPKVLGPISIGLIFSYFFKSYFTVSDIELLDVLSTLGIVMFLFYVGLELDLKSIKKQKRETIIEGILGFIIPFTVGLTFSYYVLNLSFITSFVIASILSITAEGVAVMLLQENRLLNCRPGRVIVGAGLIDDLFGIFSLTAISVIVTSSLGIVSFIPLITGLILFVTGFYFLKYLSKVIDKIFVHKKLLNSYDLFTYSIIFLLFFATFADNFGLDFSIGAIIAGLLLNFSLYQKGKLGRDEEKRIDSNIKNVSLGFLSYFFFFSIGFAVDFSILFEHIYWGISFAIIAFTMKIFSSMCTSYITKDTVQDGLLVGIGMASKGGMELIILEIARKSGLITLEIFSSLLFMSFILIILSPLCFNFIVKKKKITN
ncbi:MAG: cation:proton antiporter [Nanoarchaeales archaeon]|nr:cation:proton antiporter [Nanoarchaeales archaeon]